ncbi:MAG: hypothetical protein ACT4PE_11805 [Candidatus Eiseniibacteriota bacterium]
MARTKRRALDTGDRTVPENDNPRPSSPLASFLEENQRLITVLGVFTALTVFTASLPLKVIAYGLSFVFLSLALLVWFELWWRLPDARGNLRVFWFGQLLTLAVLGVLAYSLLEFRGAWRTTMVVVLCPVVYIPLIHVTEVRWGVPARLAAGPLGRGRVGRFVAVHGLRWFTLWLSVSVATVLSRPINEGLDRVRTALVTRADSSHTTQGEVSNSYEAPSGQ